MAELIKLEEHALTFSYGNPPITSLMTTAEVDASLALMGEARAKMLPAYPATWQRYQAVRAHRNPAWMQETDQLAGDALLHLRDPLFGWRHYIFTKDEARKIGAEMVAWADRPAPNAAGSA